MELDSVLAQIEKSSRRIEILGPNGWFAAVRMAGKQYEVIEMDQFCNAKELNRELITNSNINCDHETINYYLKISWLQYRKDDPDHIFYKYEKGNDLRK